MKKNAPRGRRYVELNAIGHGWQPRWAIVVEPRGYATSECLSHIAAPSTDARTV